MSESSPQGPEHARPLRVATVPSAHPYLDAALPADVVRVGAPAAGGSGRSAWLDPAHLAAHADEIDVLHLHSGHEHLTRAEMEAWTAAVRRSDVPLVITVHQLRAADRALRGRHTAHLRALLRTAEVVLTFTPGAADEIADRFGRTAILVAHPTMAEPVPWIGRETRLVGMHLGRLGPAIAEPMTVVRAALSGAVSGGARLRVDVHPDVDVDVRLPELTALARAGDLELRSSRLERLPHWMGYLQELSVCVLPRRPGTHSGWVEMCRDAGTRVVVAAGGHHRQQWADVVLYASDDDGDPDPTSLSLAVVAALARPTLPRADRGWRAEQRAAVRRLHAQVYAQVAADHVPG